METVSTIPIFSPDVKGIRELHQWMFEQVQAYVHGRTLVAGDGPESISAPLLAHKIPMHLNVSNAILRDALREKHQDNALVRMVHTIDFSIDNFSQEYASLADAFSTLILSRSVAYNKPIDKLIIRNCANILCTGGTLITAMPALTTAFEGLQLGLDEWKRLDRKPLKQFLEGFEVLKTRYFYKNSFQLHVLAVVTKLS